MLEALMQPAPIAALCGGGYLLARAMRRALKARCRAGPIRFAGRYWTYGQMCRHWLILGGTGRGKTFASDYLIQEVMKTGAPMGFTTVKPDDFERIYRAAEKAGHASRVVRVHPGGKHRLNLLEALLHPHGSPLTAAQFLTMVGEVGEPASQANEQFWQVQTTRALTAAIAICKEVLGKVSIPDVHGVLSTAPESMEEKRKLEWNLEADTFRGEDGIERPISRRRCADLLAKGLRMGLDTTSTSFVNAASYVLNELCGAGDRMRGGIIAGANNSLGYFLEEPWLSALNGETSLNGQMVDEHRLIAVYDYPMMQFHIPARKFQFIWTLDAQLHCMRRKFVPGSLPYIQVRDEAAWCVHGRHDSQVALVSRSQGLGMIDLVQDINSLKKERGSDAHDEVMSFVSNHAHKLLFGGDSIDTNNYASKLIGDRKELMYSGGGGCKHPTGNTLDDWLGVGGDVHWSTQYAPIMRPEVFSQLPVGVGVLLSDGDFDVIDFRKGNR